MAITSHELSLILENVCLSKSLTLNSERQNETKFVSCYKDRRWKLKRENTIHHKRPNERKTWQNDVGAPSATTAWLNAPLEVNVTCICHPTSEPEKPYKKEGAGREDMWAMHKRSMWTGETDHPQLYFPTKRHQKNYFFVKWSTVYYKTNAWIFTQQKGERGSAQEWKTRHTQRDGKSHKKRRVCRSDKRLFLEHTRGNDGGLLAALSAKLYFNFFLCV